MSSHKEISSALWKSLQPLLPAVKPSRQGGRNRLDDERVLNGILFVLRTGIAWEDLPQGLGFGSGMTCWRRLREWQASGVWHELHLRLLAEFGDAGRLDFSRVIMGESGAGNVEGVRTQAPTLSAVASLSVDATSSRI